jgi:hypothetical protein
MPKREVDKRKTSKALRKLRRAAERATEAGGAGLTTWEKDFVEGVTERLETYGSAFRDPSKGRLEEALSQRQAHVARAIDKKSRKSKTADPAAKGDKNPPGPRSTFKRKSAMDSKAKPGWTPRVRDINEDAPPPEPEAPVRKPPTLKVIPGGKAG